MVNYLLVTVFTKYFGIPKLAGFCEITKSSLCYLKLFREEEFMIPQSIIDEAIKRLVNAYKPLKIYLYGDYAWGKPDEDSHLDILIVVESSDNDQRVFDCSIFHTHQAAEEEAINMAKKILDFIQKKVE